LIVVQSSSPGSTQRILSAEEIAVQAGGSLPFLRMPQRTGVFADRAARLRSRSVGHAMADYLLFCAEIAQVQHRLLQNLVAPQQPSPDHLAQCRSHGMPPLGFSRVARGPAWRNGLRALLAALAATTEGTPRAVIDALRRQGDDYYEAQASKLLAGVMRGLDVAAAPFIGAALQLDYTHRAIALPADAIRPLAERGLCPCCGHRPVASVVRIGGNDAGYRFLHCGLCNVEWHLVRITCAHCLGTKGIGYDAIDDGTAADRHVVQAEVCSVCNHYSKICYQDRDPQVEPVADDLASLSLDILLGEAGLQATGVNLLIVHGDPQAAAPVSP
jgi:FdhE protein